MRNALRIGPSINHEEEIKMKKNVWMLLVGIALILVALVTDAFVSNTILDFSNASDLGAAHMIAIVIEALLIIAGIVVIIASRKMAKKEK